MDIKNMLESYRTKKARIAILELDISHQQKIIEYNKKVFEEDENECIQGMSISASTISDMPKSITNVTGDSTARIALTFRDNLVCTNEIDYIDAKLKEIKLQDELDLIESEVKKVDAMITALTVKEKFIVEKYYFDGFTWNDVARLYMIEFGTQNERTDSQLQRIRDEAIQKMNSIL